MNFGEWRAHLLDRLRHQIALTTDPILVDLMAELKSYPFDKKQHKQDATDYAGVIVPLKLVVNGTILSFFSTTTVFGTPIDVTLSELAIESFFPMDQLTADTMRKLVTQPVTT